MIRCIVRRARGDDGLTLVDVTIGLVILAIATFLVFNVFVTGITQARASGVQTEATAWANGEVEYLRWLGYTQWLTSSCIAASTRTIPPNSSGCTTLEPVLPNDFGQATVRVEDNALGQPGLKRITIKVFTPLGKVIYEVVTYVTQFV